MSANHIIVGAGAVGTAARLLADSGEYVTIISRSGSGPEHPHRPSRAGCGKRSCLCRTRGC